MIAILSIGLTAVAFLFALVATMQNAFGRDDRVARRLTGAVNTESEDDPGTLGIWKRASMPALTRFLTFIATLTPASLRGSRLSDQLGQAGFYGPDASRTFVGVKVLLGGAFASLTFGILAILHRSQAEQTFFGLAAGVLGFLAPAIWLRLRIARRQRVMELALPDAIDLLVVCVEAGLGLNAALVRVGAEIRWTCPPLAQEVGIVNQAVRTGMSRAQALGELALRVPIPDMQSLVAMFVQTERLGTSIGRPLRVHAESLRLRRRQRAEEQARKATVKLVFPLVFFIFPNLLVVLLGPAGIKLFDVLFKLSR